MKKKVIALLALASAFTTALVSCNGGNNGDDGEKTSDVKEANPKSLTVEHAPNKTTYVEGQKFSKTGLKIVCEMDDGSKQTLKSSDISITPNRALTLEDTKVTATYKTLSVDIPISVVKKQLESLVIVSPSSTVIAIGEAYDFSGLTVSAHYNDDSEDVLLTEEDYTMTINGTAIKASDVCALEAGKYTVTVTYQEKTATFDITVVNKVIKAVTFTDPEQTLFAKGGKYNFDGFKAHASFTDELLEEEDLKEDRLKFTINDVEIKNGGVVELGAGNYTVHVEVLRTETPFTHDFDIQIFEGYRIEAEGITNTATEEIEAASSTYVRGKKTAADESYIAYHTSSTGDPLRSFSDSKTSGGMYLGDIKPSNYIEFHFKSDIAQKASITICAASAFMKKAESDSSWNPLWIGDLQLNEVFSSKANGNAVTINDDVILPGSGSEDNTQTGVASWSNWQTVSFGEMNLQEGWNTVTIEIKAESELANYQNCKGSYTIMNLDYVQVNFKK